MHSASLLTPRLGSGRRSHMDLVAHLQRSEIFRDYQQAFETTSGFPLTLRAAGSFQPPLRGSKRINPFCSLMAGKNKTCAACLQLQQRVEENAMNGTTTLECYAGLTESAVPVRLGGTVFAYLQTGQVALRQPTRARFLKMRAQLVQWDPDIDVVELEKAYFGTRIVTQQVYAASLRLLTIFAEHLSTLSNWLVVHESGAESPIMVKARAFIDEHRGDEMSLRQVARAVGMSPFYFCKKFKAVMGMNFTEYVSRVRVERVKQQLMNPNVRVSEAAFEGGFQSLSQFNRAFRQITGEAPSSYRERIHAVHPTGTATSHCLRRAA